MKPQDIFVLSGLLVQNRKKPVYLVNLAGQLGIQPSVAHYAVLRLKKSGFLGGTLGNLHLYAIQEFLLHGFRYVFPPQLGPPEKGLPTGAAAEPLKSKFHSVSDLDMVWPHISGKIRGTSIQPLYPSVPEAIQKSPPLHQFLALLDALRAGKARERNLAADLIREKIELGAPNVIPNNSGD